MLEVTGLAATDYGDGRLAGLATAVDGKRSKLGAWLDQLADKVFVAAIIGGVACGSFASGRTEAGIIVAATGAVFVARDLYVTRKRMLAERANRGINTGAKWHGKAKTAMQFGALTALSSPAMEYAPASWGAIGLLVGAAGMSVYSALQYRRSLGQEIAATTAQE